MKKSFREYHLLKALEAFDFGGLPLDVHLSHYYRKNKALGSKDRSYISETIYGMIRWMGLIDHRLSDSHDWESRLKAYQKLNLKKLVANESIPTHIRASFPKEYFEILQRHFGEEKALALCHVSNTKAPITLRVNLLKTTRSTLLARWKDRFEASPTPHSLFGIAFKERLNFHTLEEFQKGFFEIQDEASQLIANLVDAVPGDQVLDYCAGSGGKTLAFAHKLQEKGQIFLHDIRPRALVEAKRRLKRAGIENGQIIQAKAPHLEKLKKKMDWVLVDVPCSGSGTLRRNPDMKWKFSREMLERITRQQREIFKEALSYLKEGGKIVYATCSLLPEENEEQIEFFQQELGCTLATRPFRSLPTEGGMDGFFGAVLTKG